MPEEKTLPVFEEIDQQLGASKATAPPGQQVIEGDDPTRAIVNVAPGLDPKVIKLEGEIQKLLAYSKERAVASLQDVEAATNDLSIMSGLKKALEKRRVEYLTPLRDYTKIIDAVFKLISEPLAEADRITRDKVLAFRQEQERLRLAAEEAARLQREADEAARKVREATGEIVQGQEEAPVIVPDEVSRHVHADLGTSGLTKIERSQGIEASPDNLPEATTE